jgi:zinc protease
VTHWFDAPSLRLAFLLPEVGVKGTQHATEVATALHQLDVPRGPASGSEPPPLPISRRPLAVTEHRLSNGLRVVLAPDPESIAMDARLVISGTGDDSASNLDVQAAAVLREDAGLLPVRSIVERLNWYNIVGAPVVGYAVDQTTTFRIYGLALFADWHVWHLAWTVLHGSYRDADLNALRKYAAKSPAARKRAEQPFARDLVAQRLMGSKDAPSVNIHSSKSLEAFRQTKYRPETSTLIVSGKFDVAAMRKEIESLFGDWRPQHDAVAASAARAPLVRSSVGIAVAVAPTVELAIAFAPTTAPAPRESAARAVLKELLRARMRVVRDGLGASYGVLAQSKTAATWITGEVEPAYAAEAAKAIADELDRIRAGDPALMDDFVRARKRVLAAALALPSGASSRAAALQRVVSNGGNIKQLDQEIEMIRTLSFADVHRISARDLEPERMIIAARGKQAAVEAALGSFGVTKDKVEWFAPGATKHKASPSEPPKFTATR